MDAQSRSGWAERGVLVLTAVAFALGVLWRRSADDQGLVGYDFYGQFYPYVVHAWRSLAAGGGLLWNPYQDCGQPFFGNSQTGLLYPVNLVFAVLPREPALLASVVINLTIAGIGMYQLCRTMRLASAAALCGALAFQLGWAAANLAAWSPTHIAPLAWLPVALWRTERLIQSPSARGGLTLGLVLAIQLLPGFPQTVFFTYQLIALRVVWALLLRQSSAPRALLAATALGLVAGPLLDAVQLGPALEVTRESVRSAAIDTADLGKAAFSWSAFGVGVASQVGTAGNALPVLLAVLALVVAPRLRRSVDAAYYALVTLLYFVLSLGPGSILYWLYARLPLGSTFRGPARLLWVTTFSLAALVALASQEVLAGTDRPARSRAPLVAGLLVGAVALALIAADAMRPVEIGMVAVLVVLLLSPGARLAPAAALILPGLLIFNGLVVQRPPLFGARRGDVYGAHADVFELVRARLTPQDRVLIVGGQPALELMPKSATLFALPDIHDYDALAAQRYAEFFTFLRAGRRMHDFEDWYWIFDKLLPATLQRPLFDLTAARYVIVAQPLDTTDRAFPDRLSLVLERDGVRVYENDRALPRARYVPRVELRPDAAVLPALAAPTTDLRNLAIVSTADRAGLQGTGDDGSGTVEFVADEPERVALRVRATAPGFLLLADEFFPGWTATVNGVDRAIVRANHTFRLVEVPAGESTVVFTYRPLSLRIGALITLLAVIACAWLWRRSSVVNHHGDARACTTQPGSSGSWTS